MIRVTSKDITAILDRLAEMLACKEEQLTKEEDKDYPSDERMEKITDQINIIKEAVDALENYEV